MSVLASCGGVGDEAAVGARREFFGGFGARRDVEAVPAGFTVKVSPPGLVPPPPEFGFWTPPLQRDVPAAV